MPLVRAFFSAYFALVGRYQAEALLTIVYWIVIGPTAIATRMAGRRLLPGSFGAGRSHWIDRRKTPRALPDLSRQY